MKSILANSDNKLPLPIIAERPQVFITGGSGYIGSRLIKKLVQGNYQVLAMIRKGSEHKIPAGAKTVVENPFDAESILNCLTPGSIFIQLLGVPHPSPKKEGQFKAIDLKSVKASAEAASRAGVVHFIYLSVAMTPSKLMKAYQEVRSEGEAYCIQKKLPCSFIRPWYVLGPGHWWPVLLFPFYGIAELYPPWRKKARAMGLVTIGQLLRTLINSVEHGAQPGSAIEIRDIRRAK